MSKFKLTYFDINAGRAEAVRMAAAIGDIEFDDYRISFQQFGQTQEQYPLHAVPTMEVSGIQYIQSNAMIRYVGKMAGLYPADPWQAFKCDEVLEIIEDTNVAMVKTFGLEGDEMKAARESLVVGPFTRTLNLLAARLSEAGGVYFADDQLSVADLKVFVWLRSLQSGILDHVPTNLVKSVSPELVEHSRRVAELPKVASYLSALET